jgi:hypothetical protein
MLLNYFSLVILIIGLSLVFYVFIFIHDIPYVIAKKRNHPQVEAIHVGCWLSLFTLHAIWPLVFMWAVAKQKPDAVGGNAGGEDLAARLAALERRIGKLEVKS